MSNRFLLPAATMLVGIIIWVVFIVLHGANGWVHELSPWSDLAASLLAGGLIVYSGIRCRQVGGPRVGQIIRTCILLFMAIYTLLKLTVSAGILLILAAAPTAFMALQGATNTEGIEEG